MAGTEVYSRPFFLARPLNEHLARSAISRENQLNHSGGADRATEGGIE